MCHVSCVSWVASGNYGALTGQRTVLIDTKMLLNFLTVRIRVKSES